MGKINRLATLLTNVELSSIIKLNYQSKYIMPAIPKLLRYHLIKLEYKSVYIAHINVCVTVGNSVMTISTATNI